jgi:hypothetical protein
MLYPTLNCGNHVGGKRRRQKSTPKRKLTRRQKKKLEQKLKKMRKERKKKFFCPGCNQLCPKKELLPGTRNMCDECFYKCVYCEEHKEWTEKSVFFGYNVTVCEDCTVRCGICHKMKIRSEMSEFYYRAHYDRRYCNDCAECDECGEMEIICYCKRRY